MEDVKGIMETAEAVCEDKMEKMEKIQQLVDNTLSEQSRQNILNILEQISHLSGPERLLLYLKLPGGQSTAQDPLRQPPNPLGTRHEISTTAAWVRTHLEHDPQVSVPKQDVYDEYLAYCTTANLKPLSTADFGKVMKQVFPNLRPRRLGTRGHSRYCYAAMRKARSLAAPMLPDLSAQLEENKSGQVEAWSVVQTWAEKILHQSFPNLESLAEYVNKVVTHPKDVSPDSLAQNKSNNRDQKEVKKRMLPPITKSPRAKKLKGPTNNPTSVSNSQTIIRNTNLTSNMIKDANQHAIKTEHIHQTMDVPKEAGLLPMDQDKVFNTCYSTKMVNSVGFADLEPSSVISGIPLECSDIALNLADKPLKEQINITKTCTNLVEDKSNYIMPMNLSADNLTCTNISCDTVNIKEEIQENLNEMDALNKRKNIKRGANTKKRSRNLSRRFSSSDLVIRSNFMLNNQHDILQNKNSLVGMSNSDSTPNLLYNPQNQVGLVSSKFNNLQAKPSTCVSSSFTFHPAEMQTQGLDITSTDRIFPNIILQNNSEMNQIPEAIKEEHPNIIENNSHVIPEIITEPSEDIEDDDVKVKVEHDEVGHNTLDILPGAEIPRERVISICSLDKDALDGYLHGGDNSQEQEEELLQYFQQDTSSSSTTKPEQNPVEKLGTDEKLNQDMLAHNRFNAEASRSNLNLPLTNSSMKNMSAQERLSQLRFLLEKNMYNMKAENSEKPPTYIKKYSQAVQDNLNFRQISASESLAMLSQRQNNNLLKPLPNTKINNGLSARRHVSFDSNPVSAMKEGVPQSPNTRRKNCSFMPIPSSPLSPHAKQGLGNTSPKPGSCNASPFVSPRNTPAFRSRPMFDKLMKSNKNLQTDGLPMATVSNMNIRSQSVPLHMKNMVSPGQSPLFFNMQYQHQSNAQPQMVSYNTSASSSVAATPVPAEYSDFDTPITNYMDIMNPTSELMVVTNVPRDSLDFQDDLSVPIVETDQSESVYNAMEMNQILPQTDFTDIRTLKRSMSIENNFPILEPDDVKGIASRSVPSTPISYNKISLDFPMPQQYKDFDMVSKSVPSTPVRDRSFRYSPTYRSRDFLINGNSVDAFKNSIASSDDGVIDNLSELEQQEALQISSIEQELSNFGPSDEIMADDIISELGGEL